MSDCTDQPCNVEEFARKFKRWLSANGWVETSFGAVLLHKGDAHICVNDDPDILGAVAKKECVTVEQLKAAVEAMRWTYRRS